jgi:hypothetical protein
MSTRKVLVQGCPTFTTERNQAKGMHVPLLRPTLGKTLNVIAIGDHVLGADLHWDGCNAVPCMGSEKTCRFCADKLAKRRNWFLLVGTLPTLKLHILHITNGALERCVRLYPEMESVRGYYIKIFRTGGAKNGPAHVAVEKHCGSDKLPSPIDLQAQLMRIWGYTVQNDSASA